MTVRLAMCLLSLHAVTVWAEPLLLRTAAQENASPKFVALAGSQVGGICVDVFRAIEKIDPGLRFSGDQQMLPLMRLERMLAQQQLDLACGLIRNKQRERDFVLVEPALYAADYGFAMRVEEPIQAVSWEALAGLPGDHTVLAISGSGVIERLKSIPGLKLDTSGKSASHNLTKLLHNRGRVFYYRRHGLDEAIREAGLQSRIKVVPAVIDTYQFHFTLGKHVPAWVGPRLAKATETLRAHGDLAQILKRWQP